jgi:hypothetical protein
MLALSTLTFTLTVLQISRLQQFQDPAAAAAAFGHISTVVQAPASGHLPAAEDDAQEDQQASKIHYPLWWHAPFYSVSSGDMPLQMQGSCNVTSFSCSS